jgi:glucose dehydrogenase
MNKTLKIEHTMRGSGRLTLLASLSIAVLVAVLIQYFKPFSTSQDQAFADVEWAMYGGDAHEQRFSPLSAINTDNVHNLEMAWYYNLHEGRGVEATPLMVDGKLFVTSAWSVVHALDAKTGKELWVYDPKSDREVGALSCCGAVNRGVAYLDGTIFSAAIDGRLFALDINTGELLWETQTLDVDGPYVITGAPRAAKGLVFIGNSGADFSVRGYVGAYDAKTGEKVWRFYTVPGDPAAGVDNEVSDSVLKMMSDTWTGCGGAMEAGVRFGILLLMMLN